MRYAKKLPNTNKELSKQLENEGWVKIKEPKNLTMAVLFSLPLAYLLIALTDILHMY